MVVSQECYNESMNRFKINDDYSENINRVVAHIDANLDADLSVEQLSELTFFSKYHFHRIFKAIVGETLATYVNRRRLERSIFHFKHSPNLSVTEVALKVGFQSPEHFSRCFKEKFGVTAKDYRASDIHDQDALKNRKIYQELSENSFYHVYLESREMETSDFEVNVREFPEVQVAYISDVFGDDGSNLVNAYRQLMDWAESQSWFEPSLRRYAISRDDIEITPADKYRLEFCIAVPDGVLGQGKIGIQKITGGKYCTIHVEGDIHKVAQAWDHLYKFWLPTSGFRPKAEPAVEIFLQGPETIGWEQFDLEIGVPVSS